MSHPVQTKPLLRNVLLHRFSSTRKRLLVFLAAVIVLLLWGRTELWDRWESYELIEVEDGQETFTATQDAIHAIVVCNNDTAAAPALDHDKVNITVTVRNSAGEIAGECRAQNVPIHTNGYTSVEGTAFDGLPIALQPGEQYQLQYEAAGPGGGSYQHLSFLLYGSRSHANRFAMMALCLLIFLAAVVCFGRQEGDGRAYFGVLWVILAAMTLLLMPLTINGSESGAIADVYTASSRLLRRETVDEEGNAVIEEAGLRNSGFLSYATPWVRFWTNFDYGGGRAEDRSPITGLSHSLSPTDPAAADAVSTAPRGSIVYRPEHGRISLLQAPAFAGVTLARLLRLPWQWVLIAGWELMLLTTAAAISWLLQRLRTYPDQEAAFRLIAFCPAFLAGSLSLRGQALVFLLSLISLTYWWEIFCSIRTNRRKAGQPSCIDRSKRKYKVRHRREACLIIAVVTSTLSINAIVYNLPAVRAFLSRSFGSESLTPGNLLLNADKFLLALVLNDQLNVERVSLPGAFYALLTGTALLYTIRKRKDENAGIRTENVSGCRCESHISMMITIAVLCSSYILMCRIASV